MFFRSWLDHELWPVSLRFAFAVQENWVFSSFSFGCCPWHGMMCMLGMTVAVILWYFLRFLLSKIIILLFLMKYSWRTILHGFQGCNLMIPLFDTLWKALHDVRLYLSPCKAIFTILWYSPCHTFHPFAYLFYNCTFVRLYLLPLFLPSPDPLPCTNHRSVFQVYDFSVYLFEQRCFLLCVWTS